MVTLTTYKLDDSRWSDLKLGSSEFTVKEKGITSICAASCLGADPINFVTKMNSNNGYTRTGMMRWPVAASLFDASWISQSYSKKGANVHFITSLAVKGFPVILQLPQDRYFILLDPDFTVFNPLEGNTVKLANPEKTISVHCFQKIPGTTDYMGKSQDYWLKLQKDIEDLNVQVGKLTAQVHEYSNALDAEKVKSESLSGQHHGFIAAMSGLLNVPSKPEEITKAIAEVMSANDSASKLSQQIVILKQALATEMANASMFHSEVNELNQKLRTTQDTFVRTSTDLQKLTSSYSELLMQTGGEPLVNLHFFRYNLKIYKR